MWKSSSQTSIPEDEPSQYASLALGEDDADEHEQNTRVAQTEGLPEEEEDDILRPGDHVFVWHGYTQQAHGIVLEAPEANTTVFSVDDEDEYGNPGIEDETDITILTFYESAMMSQRGESLGTSLRNLNPFRNRDIEDAAADETPLNQNSFAGREIKKQSLYSFQKGGKKVEKVKYGVTVRRRLLSRGGTATCINKDAIALVMARIKYLLDHPEILPEYKKLSANDECVAVWCRTGRWITLQGASMLEIISASQAGSTIVAAGVVSHATVTYMMPWVPGYVLVWSVPATVAYPVLIPLLVGYGLTSLVPLEMLRRHRVKWKERSDILNLDFWVNASEEDRMELFGGSMASRNSEIAKFFGVAEETDEDAAQYMPVNMDGGLDNDGFDDEDEDVLNKECNRMAATMDMSGSTPAATANRRGMFGSMVSKVKQSFRNINDSLKEPSPDVDPTSSGGDPSSRRLMYSQDLRPTGPSRPPPDEDKLLSFD